MRLDEFDKFDLKRLVTSPSWCESIGSESGEVRMISVEVFRFGRCVDVIRPLLYLEILMQVLSPVNNVHEST